MSYAQQFHAIIPARGGSKGIPNKNLAEVGGRSLVGIGVQECLASEHISEVFVTTDNEAIAVEAVRNGAHSIRRPADLSGDTASSESALLHALDEIARMGFARTEAFVFLQVTNPFTRSRHIDGACRHFLETGADSLLTASLFLHFLWRREGDRIVAINHDASHRPRRQDIDNCFHENGAFYIMRTRGFLKHRHRFFGKTELYQMEAESSFEIDEPLDLDIARLRYTRKDSAN